MTKAKSNSTNPLHTAPTEEGTKAAEVNPQTVESLQAQVDALSGVVADLCRVARGERPQNKEQFKTFGN